MDFVTSEPPTTMPVYEPNRKHKEPWHYGKSGALCPRWSWAVAQKLLENSEIIGNSRFAVRDGVAFQGHEHAPGYWHGYPVAWNEVPQKLVNRWIRDKIVSRRQVNKLKTPDDIQDYLRVDSP